MSLAEKIPLQQSETVSSTKRIAKNTLMLYFRQILIMLVSLYTVRVVLNVLGAEDYGIFGVVGGVVTFFSFLSGTMASATQRFFSFAIGKNDLQQLKETFCVNLVIYAVISVFAVILLESVGLWFIQNKMSVPPQRFDAACRLFQLSIFSFIASIIASPFMAIVIAHEDMQIYAFLSVIEAVLKLAVVYLLSAISADKLVLYGTLLLAIALFNVLSYISICIIKYVECQFRCFFWNKTLFKEIMKFTGWTLFGAFTSVGRTQAVTILLNQFFSPIVIAARTIATTVNSQVNVFSTNFNTSLYPPIIKEYASGNKEEMFRLLYNGSKMTFFLMWVFALPLFLHMDYVLTFWLKNPPEHAIFFTRLALIESVIVASALPLCTAARAPGKMMGYELALGTVQLLIFVADWILLRTGFDAWIVFVVATIGNAVMYILRLVILRILVSFRILEFTRRVLLPLAEASGVSLAASFAVAYFTPYKFVFVAFSVLLSIVFSSLAMYFLGMDKESRKKVMEILGRKIPMLKKQVGEIE